MNLTAALTMNISKLYHVIYTPKNTQILIVSTAIMTFKMLSLLTLTFSLTLTTKVCFAAKPHIMFMLVDDWGWANVGYHRNGTDKEVVTPNIDDLVKNGLELDQHYAYQYCSPSHCSLMSGRLPIHVNDQNLFPNIYNQDDKVSGFAGIPRNMTGIAEKMKMAGYATHQVGKWDAGMATPDHTPKGRGFDSSFGYFHHANDYYTEKTGSCNKKGVVDLWDTDKPAHGVNGTGQDNYEEALFRDRVLDVIKSHDPSTPLFLYYAPHIVHTPLQVPQSYVTKFSFIDNHYRQYYHAMVNYLDDVVGEIVQALKNRGLWDNLLFVASSDNGGPAYPGGGANNYPLKGGKVSDWQGGVRVNAFVSGGFLPKAQRGQKTEGYIHLADWYGTFCGLAGVDPTDTKAAAASLPPVDSMDMWPLISGQNSTSPRVDVPISYSTLISGDYKIVTGVVPQNEWCESRYPNNNNPPGGLAQIGVCENIGCFYNIKKDTEERHSLAGDLSVQDVLQDLQTKLAKYQATYFNPDRGNLWPPACDTAMNKYGGFWGPFID